jgi:hypothetical protein
VSWGRRRRKLATAKMTPQNQIGARCRRNALGSSELFTPRLVKNQNCKLIWSAAVNHIGFPMSCAVCSIWKKPSAHMV